MSAASVSIAPVGLVRASALPATRRTRRAASVAAPRRFEDARIRCRRGDAQRVRVAHPDEGFTDGNPLATAENQDLEMKLGRAAMVGFLAAVGAELATQDSIFKQLGEGGTGGMLFVFALVAAASFAPIVQGKSAKDAFLKNSSPEAFGPFNAQAEMLNGRAAMMGLLFLLAAEASQGQAFF